MKNRIGYLYVIITCFIWGSVYIASKYALASIGPLTVLCIRYLVAGACLAVLLNMRRTRRTVKKGDWKYIWIVGGLGYFVSITFQLVGTKLLDASLASLINGMNPITISLLAAVFLKEKIHKRHIASICISIAGVYIILGVGGASVNAAGLGASVCSVLLWSSASVAIRKVSGGYDPVQIALYGLGAALIFTVPCAILESVRTPPIFTGSAVLACIYLGVAGTAVAHTLWNMGLKLLDASVCSMFYPLQPLTSSILGVVLLGEVLTWNFVVGGVLICIGIIVSVMKKDMIAHI